MFKALQEETDNSLEFHFKGEINEFADLPPLSSNANVPIIIDLHGVDNLNSLGIKKWVAWSKAISPEINLIFQRIPSLLIEYVNIVPGFIPEFATIESFYVPYQTANFTNEQNVLFRKDIEFVGSSINFPKNVKSDVTGEPMEPAVLEGNYFRFLHHFNKS